jgi:hypothetical protein
LTRTRTQTGPTTLLEAMIASLGEAARYQPGVEEKPAAILHIAVNGFDRFHNPSRIRIASFSIVTRRLIIRLFPECFHELFPRVSVHNIF